MMDSLQSQTAPAQGPAQAQSRSSENQWPDEQRRLRNESKNRSLQQEGEKMQSKIHVILNRHVRKIDETVRSQEEMAKHKQLVFEQIESFFELARKRLDQRQEQLKQDYLRIEAREKRRLKQRQIKLQRESDDLKNFSVEFDDFFVEFDAQMDFMANRCQFDYFWTEFKQLETTMKKATSFFAVSEFKFPNFDCLKTELDLIDSIGKITDNSDFSMPMVAFNTHQLSAFHYIERAREFEKLSLVDEENYAANEIPHYFKSVYIPDDKFLLVGGLERETAQTSSRCFLIDDKGKVVYAQDMFVGRQYFSVATDYANDLIYVIGGFNQALGVLATFETFQIRQRKWRLCEESQHLTIPRVNASACKCGPKHIYLFGGLSAEDQFLSSIERYNTMLGIWTVLDVKLPAPTTNNFAFSFNPDYIILLGGMLKKDEKFIPRESSKAYELQDKVHVLKTKSNKWKELKPFPFKKKIGNVVYNNHGKFFCFVIESNKELPQLFVYDVRSCFPQFNKYWHHHEQQQASMQKIKGKHIQVHEATFNDGPKQDAAKLRQTQETISLLSKVSHSIQEKTAALIQRSGTDEVQDDLETDVVEQEMSEDLSWRKGRDQADSQDIDPALQY